MKKNIILSVLLLSPMVLGFPFSLDIYIPAVPHIAAYMHISAREMQLTLTLFMLTAALGQLIIGPLSDHHGRKKIALGCIIIFAAGSLLCAFAHSLFTLVLYRSIQAIGCCGMLVIAFAIVRDLFHGKDSAQVYSLLNGIIAFSPMLAPFLGSYLDVNYGWRATFLILLLIVPIALLNTTLGLKETLPLTHRRRFTRELIREYRTIAKNNVFLLHIFAGSIGISYLYIFFSISPYVIMRLLHIPELQYGYYFAFMGVSFFAGSILSAYIVRKIGIYQTVILGFLITLTGGLIMLIWYQITGLTIDNFVWPMLLIGTGGTLCLGASSAGSMEPFSEMAGAAAALGSSIRFLFSAILGSLLITDKITSTLPLAVPAVIFSMIGIILFFYFKKRLNT